jgi:hypothetical protein
MIAWTKVVIIAVISTHIHIEYCLPLVDSECAVNVKFKKVVRTE